MDAFSGFSADGLALLTALGQHDKSFFDERRDAYTSLIAEPAKAFVSAMNERLASLSPLLVGQPKVNGSIAPINNDLRFSPGKNPYKDHLLFKWWEGPDKKTAAMVYVRLSEHDVGFAVGRMFTPAVLDAWRRAVDDESTGAALAEAIDGLVDRHDADVAGAGLKRVPKPFDPDHPRAELLKHKMVQVRWPEPTPAIVGDAAFVDFCFDRLAETEPVLRWLVDQLP